MRAILCFGDSNTWGYTPGTGERYASSVRWPGVLQQTLGEGFRVIEEGLSGRTTLAEAPFGQTGSGETYLLNCLEAHQPLDLVVLMLGTNDLGVFYDQPMETIAQRVGRLVMEIQHSEAGPDHNPPWALLLAPPPIKGWWGGAGPGPMEEKSRLFATHYARVAQERGCGFLDTAEVIESSSVDGFHLDSEEHRKLGWAVAEWVTREIGQVP